MLRALILCLALSACAAHGNLTHLAAPTPIFDVVQFFTGDSQGAGVIDIIGRGPESLRVQSHGYVQKNGTIILDQVIVQGTKKRQWRMREAAVAGRYTGTLTDANGPVVGVVTGNRFHIEYPMAGGLRVTQNLYLLQGGMTVENDMSVSVLNILPVAHIRETITRKPL